jgi:diguanylate cyclase (GGDEF)-like protein
MYEKLSSRTFQLMKEVVERKNVETQLRRAATVFANALEPIFAIDERHLIVDGNASFCALAGRSCGELVGTPLEAAIPAIGDDTLWPSIWQAVQAQGMWRGEVAIRVGSAEPSPGWMTLSAINDEKGAATHYVGVLSNIAQLIDRQQQLERLAHHDALTGLPNRRYLNERIRQAMAQARRNGELLAVCYIDLDGFKEINDGFGHGVGDRALREMAVRCQSAVRGNDTVARQGGDEFIALLGDLKRPEDCTALLDRLLAEIGRPLVLDGATVALTASIGVTLFPGDDVDAEALLHHADLAMYRAKQDGKGRYRIY